MKKISLPSAGLARWLDDLIAFALAAVLCGARVFGALSPLSLGLVAAAGSGRRGFFAFAGTAVGAVMFLDFAYALRQCSIALLLYTANNAFRDMKFAAARWFLPLSTAALYACVEFVYLLQTPARSAAKSLFSLVLAVLFALCARAAREERDTERRSCALALVAMGVLMALACVQAGEAFVPSRAAAMLLVMVFSFDRPAGSALTFALAAGFAMDLAAGEGNFLYAGIYSICALAMGFEHKGRRAMAALLFCAALSVLSLPLGAQRGTFLLWEGLAASLVFLPLPLRAARGKRLASAAAEAPKRERPFAAEKLSDAAAAFFELYDSIVHAPRQPEENPAAIFDRAAERVCRGCSLCMHCWEKEYNKTYTALNDATAAILERGEGRGEDFPAYFSNRCIRFPSFLAAVNTETHNYLLRCDYRARLVRTREQAAAGYSQASQVLSAAAESLDAQRAFSKALFSYRVGTALVAKEGEGVSGDTVTFFETASAHLCLLLADGMGSGEAARRESALAVRLLERFLRAGIAASPALRTLNTAMALRGESAGGFTTVDLMTLSLHSGEAQIYKYGAAPSYVKRGGRVRRISAATLPVGLSSEQQQPERTSLQLGEGSFFLMLSDGVADALDDEWLQDFLAGWQGSDPQTLAAAVAAESRKHRAAADDVSVLALYLEEGSGEGVREV